MSDRPIAVAIAQWHSARSSCATARLHSELVLDRPYGKSSCFPDSADVTRAWRSPISQCPPGECAGLGPPGCSDSEKGGHRHCAMQGRPVGLALPQRPHQTSRDRTRGLVTGDRPSCVLLPCIQCVLVYTVRAGVRCAIPPVYVSQVLLMICHNGQSRYPSFCACRYWEVALMSGQGFRQPAPSH